MDDVVRIIQVEHGVEHLRDEANRLHFGKHAMGMNVVKELHITTALRTH